MCAACGYEAEWEECNACGGEGGHDGYEEDPLWYQPGELAPCPQCNSRGGDWWCENPKCETQNIWKLRKASKTPNIELTQWQAYAARLEKAGDAMAWNALSDSASEWEDVKKTRP